MTAESLQLATTDLKESTQVRVNPKFPSSQDPAQVSKVTLKIRSPEQLKWGMKVGVGGEEEQPQQVLWEGPKLSQNSVSFCRYYILSIWASSVGS